MLRYGVKTNDNSSADANAIVQAEPEQQQQQQYAMLLYKQGLYRVRQHHWIGWNKHNISCKY